MKVAIEFDEKEQQIIESIFEDNDKDAAYNYIVNTLRPRFKSGSGDIKCGHIFSKSGEKK